MIERTTLADGLMAQLRRRVFYTEAKSVQNWVELCLRSKLGEPSTSELEWAKEEIKGRAISSAVSSDA